MLTTTQIKKHIDTNEKLFLQTHYKFLYNMLEEFRDTNTEKLFKYKRMLAYHLIDIINSNLLTNKEKLEYLECNQITIIEKQSGDYYSLYNYLSAPYRHFQARDTTLKGIFQETKTFLEMCLEKEFKVF